jgi:L-aminopeptidase/D-esterase-like protein
MARVIILFLAIVSAPGFAQQKTSIARPRTSDLGLKVGILPLGPLNGITDVAGVRVGHTTIVRGDNIRTGVTAILPHAGNLYREKVPGAVGVLVQTNFGGVLPIAGVPVGFELRQYYLRQELQEAGSGADHGNGSCMIVVATDAPMDARNLKRLAARTLLGLARTGSAASNGSGDYAIAFSTAPQVRIHGADSSMTRHVELINNDAISRRDRSHRRSDL